MKAQKVDPYIGMQSFVVEDENLGFIRFSLMSTIDYSAQRIAADAYFREIDEHYVIYYPVDYPGFIHFAKQEIRRAIGEKETAKGTE